MSFVGSALAMAGATVVSGLIGANANKNAAKQNANAQKAGINAQREMFDKQVELQAPFREGALKAQNRLLTLLGLNTNKYSSLYGTANHDFGMEDFQVDPGYQFRLTEGLKALDRQAAARNGLISGHALKAAERYGQDMGSQEYQNAFNRYQINRANKLQPLQSMMGIGQTATNALSGAAQQYGNAMQTGYNNIGSGYANATTANANLLNNSISSYMNYSQNQNMLKQLYGNGGAGGGFGGNGYVDASNYIDLGTT